MAIAKKSSTQFTVGNTLWRARSRAGPKPLYDDPEELWKSCVEYFEWNQKNPLYETRGFAFQGKVTKEKFPKMRAMSLGALCVYLKINRATWNGWRNNRPDLSEVIAEVEEIIFAQKFEGASADLLNANIISRELGLADKLEAKQSFNVTIDKEDADL